MRLDVDHKYLKMCKLHKGMKRTCACICIQLRFLLHFGNERFAEKKAFLHKIKTI